MGAARGQAVASNWTSPLPVLMLTMRPPAQREKLLTNARSAGIDALRFIEAVDGARPHDDDGCVSSLDFSAVQCSAWRRLAVKRTAQTCSHIRVAEEIVRLGTPALALEDDIVFRPTVVDFQGLFPRLLEHLRGKQGGWDLVHLGPCLEQINRIRTCEFIGTPPKPLWLSPSFQPACTHAMLITPSAAAKLRVMWSRFRLGYHVRVTQQLPQAPADCEQGVNRWQKNATLKLAMRSLNGGDDQVMRSSISKGAFASFNVWPMLVEQADHLHDPMFSLAHRKPAACRPSRQGA
ncbi:hypothetical protein KFE25_006996 [Diacronema lutheri]|uniref:Uncharacterized protein n=1 Tax=Diacronema lutheri TaxID=2081491 RepID=A0A8J5XX20_DIALT|nr:hypothetical protein KFE25_006996 [Diacronema lutheri]